MIRIILLLAFFGCREDSHQRTSAGPASTASLRTRSAGELASAVAAYKLRVEKRPLPTYGDPDYLEPPTEAELAWVTDRATPMDKRITDILSLFDDSKLVMKAYSALDLEGPPQTMADGPVTLRWSETIVRQFGHMIAVMLDELVPTLSPEDPSYETRMNGLTKMGAGSEGMLRGALITLGMRRADLDARRRLAIAWRDHASNFARVFTPARCESLRVDITSTARGETDPTIRDAFASIREALTHCRGRAR